MTVARPSAQPTKSRPRVRSASSPRAALHPLPQLAATERSRSPMASVRSCQVFVNARPCSGSMTSDSGPSATAMRPAWTSAGFPFGSKRKISIASASGSVTQTSPGGSTQRT